MAGPRVWLDSAGASGPDRRFSHLTASEHLCGSGCRLSSDIVPRSASGSSVVLVGRTSGSLRTKAALGWTLPEAKPRFWRSDRRHRVHGVSQSKRKFQKMAGPFETLDAALEEAHRALTAIGNGEHPRPTVWCHGPRRRPASPRCRHGCRCQRHRRRRAVVESIICALC